MGIGTGDRDGAGDIKPYGIWFAIQVQPLEDSSGIPIEPLDSLWQDFGFFFIRDKSEKPKNYSISLTDLPYKKWYIRFVPHIQNPNEIDPVDVIRLDTNGTKTTYTAFPLDLSSRTKLNDIEKYNIAIPGGSTGINQNFNVIKYGVGTSQPGGGLTTPKIKTEAQKIKGSSTSSVSERNYINITLRENYDKRVASSDSGAPLKLLTVSEITYPSQVEADITYKGICVLGAKIRTSDRMSGAPELSLFISEGRVIRNHVSAGIHQGTNGLVLLNYEENFTTPEIVSGVTFAYNLETGLINQIGTKENANEINTPTINWNTGDRFVLFNIDSSNYFPDIYVDMLINPEGGLGGLIEASEFIDYESIVEANRFVKANNFFFDGVLIDQKEFAAWATEEAALSKLVPSKIEGKFGLIIEKQDLPTEAIFNESNIIKDSFEEEYVPWQENSINQVVLTYTNGADLQRPITAVTARAKELNQGLEKLVTFNIDGLSVTDTAQAISVASLILKSKRLQNRAVRFSTALQGLFLRPGSKIVVQHQINEFDFETSGYVTAIKAFNDINKTQSFLLSRSYLAPAEVSNYRATVQLQSNGEVYENLQFTIVQEEGIQLIRFADQSIPSTLSVGDPVMISKITTENRSYRVQNITRDTDSKISITAIFWTEEMFNYDDVEIILE